MLALLKKLFGGRSVNYKELVSNGAIIIDVRSTSEYKTGHIIGSKNFPLDNIRTKVTELKKTINLSLPYAAVGPEAVWLKVF